MKNLILVFLGGGLGSSLRYYISLVLQSNSLNFPKATFAVNLMGALLIGLIIGYQLKHSFPSHWHLLLAVGFCGGFTTFSTLSLEVYQLYKAGAWGILSLYLGSSLLLGILLVALGIFLSSKI